MDPELCSPCKLVTHEDETYSLIFDDFGPTEPVFSDTGFEGGGYGWHGVVVSLIGMKDPDLRGKVSFDPEAGMFVANGPDLAALKQVASLIREAVQNPILLREAIEKADPDLMD